MGRVRNNIVPIKAGIYGEDSDTWNTSFGGGAYVLLAEFTNLNFAYFTSDEGGRIGFGLSMPF
jgi:hypothetical protein